MLTDDDGRPLTAKPNLFAGAAGAARLGVLCSNDNTHPRDRVGVRLLQPPHPSVNAYRHIELSSKPLATNN